MKYINAADVLPMELLKELSAYVNGQLLYVPSMESKNHGAAKAVLSNIMSKETWILSIYTIKA